MKYLWEADCMCTDHGDGPRCRLSSMQRSVLLHVQVEDVFLAVGCRCWVFPDMAGR